MKKFDSFENKSRLSSSSITSQRLKESTKYDIKSSEIKIIDLPYEELTENLRLKAKIEELEQNNAFLIKENKQKNDYLNLLFESGKSAQALFSENYNILKVNNKFEQISGYKNSEIGVNHYLKIFFNKKEWKRIDKLLKNLIEENQSSISRTITTKFISKNNITRSIELYFSKRQEQKQFIVCINDITEENKYEQDLIRRNKELTILNEISKSVIHPKNLDQVLKISLEKSKQLSEMEIGVVYLGKQQLKSLKSVAVIGINKEKANKIIEQNYNSIQQLKKKKKNLFLNISNNFFIDIFSKSSTCKSLVFIPLLISKNTFGILGLASKKNIEFTQEKKQLLSTIGNHLSVNIENCILFNELKEKNKTIEEKNEELSSFVCTVSHDLKTPIIALHGFLGLFTERFKKDIDQTGKDYIERVLSNAEYMEKMINDLLKLSRAGKVVGAKRRFSTYKLLKEINMLLYPEIYNKNINIVLSKTLPLITGYRPSLQTVFTNLIDNSIKYSTNDKQTHIEINCKDRKKYYEFTVKDNGIGIANENQIKIFEVFQKCAKSKDVFQGTGVGLTIAKKIIEHHGGKIWVESKQDKGATFYFTLPK